MKSLFRLCMIGLLSVALLILPVSCSPSGSDVSVRDLTWAVGAPLPRAEDFVSGLQDGYSVRYAEEYSFDSFRTYSLQLILTAPNGWESKYNVTLTLVQDTEPPTIAGLRDLTAYVGGEGVSYLSGVITSDNCDGKVTLQVDSSAVDLKREGVYPVVYTATDAAGNVAVVRMTVTVLTQQITKEMLYSVLDDVIDDVIDDGMTKKQKLRAIYDYVYDHVSYTSIADKSSWVSAAYEGLTTGSGDCYTYFALSKAFFERLGIENMDMERMQSAVLLTGERHFWNLVNLGTTESPQWYHFDACHLSGLSKPWGFLMTDAQLQNYANVREGSGTASEHFYDYDTSAYPEIAWKTITSVD